VISNAGNFSLHDGSNDSGTNLADLAVTRNVAIGSMMFPHMKCKETWVSPDGLTRNQNAHTMIDARHISDITDVRCYKGTNCDSDHIMVKIKCRSKIEIMNKSPGGRNMKFDTQKFKDGPIFKVCQPLKTILTIRMFMIKMTLTKMDIYQTGHTCSYRRNYWNCWTEKKKPVIWWRLQSSNSNEMKLGDRCYIQRKTWALVDE